MVVKKKNTRKKSDALVRAQKKYDKKTKLVALRFHEDEMDLYEIVHNQENSSQYLKDLIRADNKKRKNKK